MRLQQLREHRERSRKVKRKEKRLRQGALRLARQRDALRRGINFDRDMAREQIVLPPIFSFWDNYDETVAVILSIREHGLRRNRRVLLHFTQVEVIDPAAALVLVAEIFRVRNLRSYDTVTGSYPRSRFIYELLREMGFYELLDIQERRDLPEAELDPGRPVFLRFSSSNRVDSELVDRLVSVVEQHLFKMNEIARGRLVAAIIEAMNNTLDHAHPIKIANETMPNRWWISASVDLVEREVMVMLFDQGVGIPATLEPTTYERIRARLRGAITLKSIASEPSDGEMILAATELHRTGTGREGRGRGFRNMKQFVDVCADGELRVLSNRGRYSYMREAEAFDDETESIGGTVIEWRFRHEGTVDLKDD